MKQVLRFGLLAASLMLSTTPLLARGSVAVRGHWRGNTYVAPHFRSSPDRSISNNWSASQSRAWSQTAPASFSSGGNAVIGEGVAGALSEPAFHRQAGPWCEDGRLVGAGNPQFCILN